MQDLDIWDVDALFRFQNTSNFNRTNQFVRRNPLLDNQTNRPIIQQNSLANAERMNDLRNGCRDGLWVSELGGAEKFNSGTLCKSDGGGVFECVASDFGATKVA
jgi:hypothetical protein